MAELSEVSRYRTTLGVMNSNGRAEREEVSEVSITRKECEESR